VRYDALFGPRIGWSAVSRRSGAAPKSSSGSPQKRDIKLVFATFWHTRKMAGIKLRNTSLKSQASSTRTRSAAMRHARRG